MKIKIVAGLLIILNCSLLFSNKKADVMDSLLQNVIDYFYTKIPKFIDKYGKDRFVADEPLTRGSILLLLYEYEQSLKKEFQTIDISSIHKKIEILEKKLSSIEKQSFQPQQSQPAKIDIFEIMKELSPNMPVMLDTTLEKSEVFNSLKKDVEMLKSAKITQPIQQPISTKEVPQDITSRTDKLEESKKEIENLKQLTQKLDSIEKNFSKLALRLENIENNINKKPILQEYPSNEAKVGGYLSILTKISLGLSIFSLLFIAR